MSLVLVGLCWASQKQPSRHYGNSVALVSDEARNEMSRVQETVLGQWLVFGDWGGLDTLIGGHNVVFHITYQKCLHCMCFLLQTLKNSKSLCSLDYEDDEDDTQTKTVVSSPCNSQGLVGIITPSSSPRIPRPGPASLGEGGSSGDPSDWDSAGEEGIFPLDHGDLDLEQIENN